jgi:hypothetical protein
MDETKKYHYHGNYQKLFWVTCKCCGRETEYKGRGCPKTYCETCFPQITALKQVLNQMRHEKDNAKICKQWYDNNTEIVVAVGCVFCDTIIIGRTGKLMCDDCKKKWQGRIPHKVITALANRSSFELLPRDLLAWTRIIFYRKQGIYSFK